MLPPRAYLAFVEKLALGLYGLDRALASLDPLSVKRASDDAPSIVVGNRNRVPRFSSSLNRCGAAPGRVRAWQCDFSFENLSAVTRIRLVQSDGMWGLLEAGFGFCARRAANVFFPNLGAARLQPAAAPLLLVLWSGSHLLPVGFGKPARRRASWRDFTAMDAYSERGDRSYV